MRHLLVRSFVYITRYSLPLLRSSEACAQSSVALARYYRVWNLSHRGRKHLYSRRAEGVLRAYKCRYTHRSCLGKIPCWVLWFKIFSEIPGNLVNCRFCCSLCHLLRQFPNVEANTSFDIGGVHTSEGHVAQCNASLNIIHNCSVKTSLTTSPFCRHKGLPNSL